MRVKKVFAFIVISVFLLQTSSSFGEARGSELKKEKKATKATRCLGKEALKIKKQQVSHVPKKAVVSIKGKGKTVYAYGNNTICLSGNKNTVVVLNGAEDRVHISGGNHSLVFKNKGKHQISSKSGSQKIDVERGTVAVLSLKGKGNRIKANNLNGLILKTGAGNDFAQLSNVQLVGINTGTGNDYVQASGIKSARIETGFGNDRVGLKKVDNLNLKTGAGDDRVGLIDSKASGFKNIYTGAGDDIVGLYNNKSVRVETSRGDDTVGLGKIDNLNLMTGAGDDKVGVAESGISSIRSIYAGVGNDAIKINSYGVTRAFLGKENAVRDTDFYQGGAGVDRVIDVSGGTLRRPNIIRGGGGPDKIFSLRSAYSYVEGETGNDKIYSSSSGVSRSRLSGGKNNDIIHANYSSKDDKVIGSHINTDEGDDVVIGSQANDIIIALSGINTIDSLGGNDYVLRGGFGLNYINAGKGVNTLSYLAFANPSIEVERCSQVKAKKYPLPVNGIDVNLGQSQTWKFISQEVAGNFSCSARTNDHIENQSIDRVFGSSGDDIIFGKQLVVGAEGDDRLFGKKDRSLFGDIGLKDQCSFFNNDAYRQIKCHDHEDLIASENELVIIRGSQDFIIISGTPGDDHVKVSYGKDGLEISSNVPIENDKSSPFLASICHPKSSTKIVCSLAVRLVSGIIVNSGDGNDYIEIDETVPAFLYTALNGGDGRNVISGGNTDDVITAGKDKSLLLGGKGNDQIFLSGTRSRAAGGEGDDAIFVRNSVCSSSVVSGGPGKDSLVFAGFPEGIYVSMRDLIAAPLDVNKPRCLGKEALNIRDNFEALEGTAHSDLFIGSKTKPMSFLGRQGPDRYDVSNDLPDRITSSGPDPESVAEGVQVDSIFSDSKDKVKYCWGGSRPPEAGDSYFPEGCLRPTGS